MARRTRSRPMTRAVPGGTRPRAWGMSGRPAPSPRRRARAGWRAMPVALIVVPRAIAVIVAPIRPDGEGDNRQTDHRAVVEHWHRITLIRIAEQCCIDPAACAGQTDVAPRVIGQAAIDRYRHPRPRLSDDRIVHRRARPHIGRRIDHGLSRLRRRHVRQRNQRCCAREHERQSPFVHVRLPVMTMLRCSKASMSLPGNPAARANAGRPCLHVDSTGRIGSWFAVTRNETRRQYLLALRDLQIAPPRSVGAPDGRPVRAACERNGRGQHPCPGQ